LSTPDGIVKCVAAPACGKFDGAEPEISQLEMAWAVRISALDLAIVVCGDIEQLSLNG
jgi:hypothetical protein